MPLWIMAGVWGFVAGLALLLGVAAGYSIYIFGMWAGIVVISGIAILLGYALCGQFLPDIVAANDGRGGRSHAGHASRYDDSRSVRECPQFRWPNHSGGIPGGLCIQQSD